MSSGKASEVTQVLSAIGNGDSLAMKKLLPMVYDDFRALASSYLSRESSGHTLQPTAMVNETFLKLVDQKHVTWQNKSLFFAVGAQAMRRILVDHARSKQRVKRGGGRQKISLDEELTLSPQRDEDILALDDALEKLQTLDKRQSKIVELRFFGGLNVKEAAEVLGVSKRRCRLGVDDGQGMVKTRIE